MVDRDGMRYIIKNIWMLLMITVLAIGPAQAGEDAFVGSIVGAGVGGYLGSMVGRGAGQVAAATTGVVVGGIAGNAIGQSMDNASMARTGSPNASGFFSDPPPASMVGGSYVPNYVAPPDLPPPAATAYVNGASGTYCRQYSRQYLYHQKIEEEYGLVCLQPDGSWHVVQ